MTIEQEDLTEAKPTALRRLAKFLGLQRESEMTDKQVRIWIKYEVKPPKGGCY